tara:strand:- start:411 stop:1649 length:1239 start_codon:yes stop_codon:yes gene_type:complete
MNFTDESQKIIEMLIKLFKNHYKKQSAKNQKINDSIFSTIYYNINRSAIDVDLMEELSLIKTEIKETINKSEIKNIDLFNSRFVPDNVKKYIETYTKSKISFSTTINKKEIILDFYLTEYELLNELEIIKKFAKKILILFKYLSSISESKCSKKLRISFFRTPLKKQLPKYNYLTIGPINANTAVTYHCEKDNSILIFRKEEMFKTCIHEMIHALGLDWNELPVTKLKQKMKKLFKIKSNMETPEAYAEFWACILNSCFASYYLSDKNIDEYLVFVEYFLQFEKFYSLYQVSKILNFMNVNYVNLYQNNTTSKQLRNYMYKENTNIFMYYILKTLLLYNSTDFLHFCKNNNKNIINFLHNEDNMDKLYNFISKRHNSLLFISDINKIFEELNKKKIPNSIRKSMRLTAIELE